MKISNWDKWQTYRSDRSTPPWIKVHRNLFSNSEWSSLTDSEKGQLVSIWILAADKKGEIPDCAKTIQKMCMIDKAPNINKFIELGFLVTTWLPDGCQGDDNMTHQTRLEETRLDKTRGEETKKRFAPPSLNEVKEAIKEKQYSVNPNRFFNHYESNGWRVGKNPMKSWKAALANWNSSEKKPKANNKADAIKERMASRKNAIDGECHVVK